MDKEEKTCIFEALYIMKLDTTTTKLKPKVIKDDKIKESFNSCIEKVCENSNFNRFDFSFDNPKAESQVFSRENNQPG